MHKLELPRFHNSAFAKHVEFGGLLPITVRETADDNCFRAADDNCSCWPLLFAEFDDEAFCLCPAAKCVSGMALLWFAGGSLKAV